MASDDTPDIVAQRRHIHQALAQIPSLDDEMPDDAFLSGWVTIAEYVDPDGSRWFVHRRGTDGGETDLTPWDEKGMLTHALQAWQAKATADAIEDGGDE